MADSGNKEVADALKDLKKTLEDYGYVGNVGQTPMYSEEALQARDALREATAKLKYFTDELGGDASQAIKDYGDDIKKLKEASRSFYREIVRLNEKKRTTGLSDSEKADLKTAQELRREAREEIKGLQEKTKLAQEYLDAGKTELDYKTEALKKQLEEQRVLKKINEELTYQNKKLDEGVTFQERTNHFLNQHVMNVRKFSNGWNELKRNGQELLNNAKELMKPWGVIDQAAANYAKHIGQSRAQFGLLRHEILTFARDKHIEERYNTSAAELIQMQEQYGLATNRNTGTTEADKENLAGLKVLTGSTDAAAKTAALFDSFAMNLSSGADRIADIFKKSQKHGIAFAKYSEIFTNNLKLAQTYTFRNGLKGLSAMAEKSAALRLDMQQVANAADKVSTLEGAMQAGAQLSVLGGPFSSFGNPLQLLSEGLMDMESLQDRIIAMFGEFAKFNQATGQLEVSAFNRQRVKAAADAMGMNYQYVMDMIYAKGRRNILEPSVNSITSNKDERELLLNKAQLDENGQGYVVVNGQKKYLSKGRENSITKEDISHLTRTNFKDSDNIATIASTLLGWEDRLEAFQKGIDDSKANIVEQTGAYKAADKILNEATKHTAMIGAIQTLVQTMAIGMNILAMGNGFGNMMGSFGGKGVAKLSPNPIVGGGGAGTSTAPMVTGANAAKFSGVRANYNAAYNAAGGMGIKAGWNSAYGAARTAGAGRFGAGTKAAGAVMGKGFSNMGSYGVPAMLLGMVGSAAGDYMKQDAQNGLDEGKDNDSTRSKYKWGGSLSKASSWAGMGAMVGSFFGPWGTAIGAIVGGIAGGIAGYQEGKDNLEMKDRKKSIYKKSGERMALNDEYELDTLRSIDKEGTAYIERKPTLRAKIFADTGLTPIDLNEIHADGFKDGGIVKGRGNETSDSNLALLSNNEYVMPANRVTQPQNRMILDSMRDGRQMQIMKVASTTPTNITPVTSVTPQKIEFSPINLSGTIKLDLGGYSKDVDSKALLNNPLFLKHITDEVMKRVNTQTHGGYDKNSFYKKF